MIIKSSVGAIIKGTSFCHVLEAVEVFKKSLNPDELAYFMSFMDRYGAVGVTIERDEHCEDGGPNSIASARFTLGSTLFVKFNICRTVLFCEHGACIETYAPHCIHGKRILQAVTM